MNYLSHPFIVWLRNIGRKIGVNSLIARILSAQKYEGAFDMHLNDLIKVGETVWDVGANMGYYSKKFSNLVGESGSVYAFEPSPSNLLSLEKAVNRINNIHIRPFALGDKDQVVQFRQGDDPLGATSGITNGVDDKNTEKVVMYSGDTIIFDGVAPFPNVIKIDVEGFEYEVILGLTKALKNSALRVIGIEIHFGLLDRRAMNFAPMEIVKILQSINFKVRWPDNSHIIAQR